MQTDIQPKSASTIDLSGQVALVTGAGSGIGRAMALAFAGAGAAVIVVDIVAARVEETVALVRDASGEAQPVVADLGDEAAITSLAGEACARWGRMDILCNNAGIMDRMQMAADVPTELWDRVIRVNLTAPFLLTRAVLPTMIANQRGCIINTASIASLRGGAAGFAYTTAKHGLLGQTKNIAWGYAQQGIRCNAICPGAAATNIVDQDGFAAFDQQGLGRFGMVLGLNGSNVAGPDKIASVALFLASEGASFVNGAVIPIDMGWSIA